MKDFITYNTIRDNGLLLARRMYDEGYTPEVIYTLMRGGAYLGNIISEFFKLLLSPIPIWEYTKIPK